MFKLVPFLLIVPFGLFMSSMAFSQDTIRIDSSVNGLVYYDYDSDVSNTLFFTLFGDGTFEHSDSPKHRFAASNDGYETQVYFAKPYRPTDPPKRVIQTDTVRSGSTYNNGSVFMSGPVKLFRSWASAKGFSTFYIVAFRNDHSATPVDGCLEFHYNNNQIAVDTNNIQDYDFVEGLQEDASSETGMTHKLKWDFEDLAYNETRYVYVPADCLIRAGRPIGIKTKYLVNCSSTAAGSGGSSDRTRARRYPHDPNFKAVDRDCLNPNNPIQQLHYTIGFYNDGNYYAENVFVRDEISHFLDMNSLEVVEAEYDYYFEFEDRWFLMDFLNINLPGINQESADIITYDDASSDFTFKICTNHLPPGIEIYNEASIQFDQQEIYITDPVLLGNPAECTEEIACGAIPRSWIEEATWEALVYPNPFEDLLQLDIGSPVLVEGTVDIKLFDLQGRLINNWSKDNLAHESIKLSLGDVETGAYMLEVKIADQNKYYKVMKL